MSEHDELDDVLEHLLLGGTEPPHADSEHPLVRKLHRVVRARLGDSRVFSYLSTMSHELRTPLNAVIGYSELILDELDHYDPDALKRDVTRIHHAGRHLLGLIDEVVDVSKLESGSAELARTTLDVRSFLQKSLPGFAAMVAERDNQLEWSIGSGLRVRTDASKLQGILRMLIQRASRVTQAGRIVLEVLQEDEELVFRVVDTGDRIPPEELAQSFLTFDSGQGRGVSTAFRVAQLLGGVLTAETGTEGSTFTLRLPALDMVTEDDEPVPIVHPGEQVVLVIDDDPTSHDLVARHLATSPCRVVSAFSGPEALRIVETLTPDVIALEAVLPDMDGWEVLARLRAKPHLAATPVVMMSMLPDVGGRAVGLGADAFMTKPFDRLLLLDHVQRLVGEARRRILVVDDEPDARELVRRALLPAGHLVDEVEDGAGALAYLQRQHPDLILLDLMMPEMDGFEVVRQLQSDPELARIPLVVLTGMTLSESDRKRLASTSVVQKGTGDRSVLESIEAALVRTQTPATVPRAQTPKD
ncbi:MAG: response regulator [Myxococcales bacterium]|nr:response regulator [Myxococcales bacterium]MCB9669713.1 response regulator [Alphaproteobacteria bacterium]